MKATHERSSWHSKGMGLSSGLLLIDNEADEDIFFQVATFVTRHQAIFTAGELASIAAIQENIAASITWSNENSGIVDEWLRENYGSNASGLIPGLVVLLSFAVALFNY